MKNQGDSDGIPAVAPPSATTPAGYTGDVCRFCNIGLLRRSRLRAADAPWLLVLHWPVRCLRCGKRQYLLWPGAIRALPSHTPHAPELLTRQSWQTYTATGAGAVPAHPAGSQAPPAAPSADEGDRS